MFDASLIPVYGPKLANWSLPRDSVTSYAINKGLFMLHVSHHQELQ